MDTAIFSTHYHALSQETWGPWCDLEEKLSVSDIPDCEGLYRVAVMDKQRRLLYLTYIGQSGRGLHERLGDLRRKTYGKTRPGSTPHVAAPAHWDYLRSFDDGQHFECSVFALPGMRESSDRKILEGLAITLWRQHHSLYPLVNFGQIRTETLQDRFKFVSTSLLHLPCVDLAWNTPFDTAWLKLPWSPWMPVSCSLSMNQRGIYRLRRNSDARLMKVGFGDLQSGLQLYRPRKNAMGCLYEFSWLADTLWSDYHYRALCNDLVSSHAIAHCGISVESVAA